MDRSSCLFLRALMLSVATAGAHAIASEPVPPSGDVIEGLGERVPANAKNVSLSSRFKVYKFERHGVTYMQINSAQDEVLTAMIVTPGAQQQLPIGSAAGTPVVFVESPGQP